MTRLRPRLAPMYGHPTKYGRDGDPQRDLTPDDYLVSRPQVARVLGITPQAVGMIERRAVEKLRAAMMNDPVIRELAGVA